MPASTQHSKRPSAAVIKPMRKAQIEAFFATLERINPLPKTELEYSNAFELLVAVMLSARVTDAGVNKATKVLFPIAHTPQKIRDLGEQGLRPFIQSIGLYKTKARHIVQTCHLLLSRHDDVVPSSREALEALPGVGRKTASVVLNVAFGETTMPVDTHVFRLSNRTGLAPGRTVQQVEQALLQRIPKHFLAHAHHWLVLHGRYVCLARRPRCYECLVSDFCNFTPKTKSP